MHPRASQVCIVTRICIYIGFWALTMKCTQYGLHGQVAFKNPRIKSGSGWPRLGDNVATLVRSPLLILIMFNFSKATSANLVSSPYHRPFNSYVDHQTSYICFRYSPLRWWPMVRCELPSMEIQSYVDHHVAGATL